MLFEEGIQVYRGVNLVKGVILMLLCINCISGRPLNGSLQRVFKTLAMTIGTVLLFAALPEPFAMTEPTPSMDCPMLTSNKSFCNIPSRTSTFKDHDAKTLN